MPYRTSYRRRAPSRPISGRPHAFTRLREALVRFDHDFFLVRRRLRDAWADISVASQAMRPFGWRRALVELSSEGLTLATAGAIVMLAFAIPAFRATTSDWRTESDFAVTFLDRYGNEIGRRGTFRRDSVPVDEMPDMLIKAVLATEDRRFFSHYGIDGFGLLRALGTNLRANGVVQGGSTLTQQLAKNLFLSNERTVERKINEAFLSLWLEANLSKKEILQLYLDRAYMGGPAFGMTAAADFYFNKDVRDLDLAECAMLAGLFKAPARYAPHVDLPAARARANEVLGNLVQSGFMTEGEVLQARLHPASVVDRGNPEHPDYFLDWAFEEAKRIAQPLGLRVMTARTTIDLDHQRAAEEALEAGLREFGTQYNVGEGAIVLMETNGAVRAIVGGRDYGRSQFNRATAAERQPGSSFKPYVYALAMERGMTPDTVISDAPITWDKWKPKNYSRSFSGAVTLRTALAHSINTVPVRLAKEKLDLDGIVAMAKALGVESPLSPQKTIVLGTADVTVMDQATAYNTFANGGLGGTRFGISQLVGANGAIVYDHTRDAAPPRRVLSPQAVAGMNDMLSAVVTAGTAKRAALPGIPSAGKTGTTQSYRDAWYVGFTGNFTAAVWLGNDNNAPTAQMTGGSVPAIVWHRMMSAVHRGAALRAIPGLALPAQDGKAVAQRDDTAGTGPAAGTARVLSDETAGVLRTMTERFKRWPAAASPEVLTRL